MGATAPGAGAGLHRQGAAKPTYPGLAQRRQSAGLKTPTRFDFGQASGLQSPDGQLLRMGAQFELDPFEDDLPRKFDLDHRTRLPVRNGVLDPLCSPKAALIDTVARLQLDMEEIGWTDFAGST